MVGMGLGNIFSRMGAQGRANAWVLSGGGVQAGIDMDFANARYFGKKTSDLTITNTSSSTDLLYTAAAGASYNTFASGSLRLTPGVITISGGPTVSGYLHEPTRTNSLLNSTAPATQTTGSLGTGTYTLWVNGTGSAAVSAGTATITGAGAATNGAPVTFTVTVAGTVTVTKTGSLNAFQLENGSFPTSLIVTAGATVTRNRDLVIMPVAFGSAFTLYARFTPMIPASDTTQYEVIDADNADINQRTSMARSSTGTLKLTEIGGTGGTAFTTPVMVPYTSNRGIVSISAGAQALALNGNTATTATIATLPTTPTQVSIGSISNQTGAFCGIIERITIWPTAAVASASIPAIGSRIITGLVEMPKDATRVIDGITFIAQNADYSGSTMAHYAAAAGNNPSTGGTLDRFELRTGDIPFYISTSERTEYSGDQTKFSLGTTFYVAYSIFITSNSNFPATTIIGQVHDIAGGSDVGHGPPLEMHMRTTGSMRFVGRSSTENPMVDVPADNIILQDNSPTIGAWVNYVHMIKMDPTGSGRWKCWRGTGTGALSVIFDYTGALGYATDGGSYWKYGDYGGRTGITDPLPSIIWYTNMRCGTTDITSLATTPAALPLDTPY